jgi:hypothetical protein
MSAKCQIDIMHTYNISIKLIFLYHIRTMAQHFVWTKQGRSMRCIDQPYAAPECKAGRCDALTWPTSMGSHALESRVGRCTTSTCHVLPPMHGHAMHGRSMRRIYQPCASLESRASTHQPALCCHAWLAAHAFLTCMGGPRMRHINLPYTTFET